MDEWCPIQKGENMIPTIKLVVSCELPYATVEQFDKWRDAVDDGEIEVEGDTCDVCPVKQLCDISMKYDAALEEQLGCSGIYKLAIELKDTTF